MTKLPECDRCLYCARDYHLVCAVHPTGVERDACPDFVTDPELEGKRFEDFLGLQEQTEPLVTYYGGYPLVQPQQLWTAAEQLQLLEMHPLFTKRCPACGVAMEKDFQAVVYWDCECGWTDDSLSTQW